MSNEGKIRLNKFIASCGICSRRDADKLIEKGQVVVNEKIALPGTLVDPKDVVLLNQKVIKPKDEKVVLAYYKPIGVVCTEKDKHAEKKVNEEFNYPVRVTYAGRLDKDSEGLLIMTNDGDLIEAMMRGSKGHEKEYTVKVNKEITDDFLLSMSKGIYLKELNITTRLCKISKIGKYTFQIILTQGVNRQIRRMCKELGYEVKSLKRERVVNIQLAKMKPGEWRKIENEELQVLYNKCRLVSK